MAYILRFVTKSQGHHTATISSSELHQSLIRIVLYVQQSSFSEIFVQLKNNSLLPKPLRKLAVFVDLNGLIRVGGRL